ncbi:MAG: hypothetical protein ACLR2E_07445 [Lachnospiraceae bacterium]
MMKSFPANIKLEFEVARLDPLFAPETEYDAVHRAPEPAQRGQEGDFSTYEGNCFLGIDAGSTTTKAALVGEDGSLLYSFYSSNNGSPLATAIRAIKEIYCLLPETRKIVHSCSTGYGEALIKAGPDAGRGRGGDHLPLLRCCLL